MSEPLKVAITEKFIGIADDQGELFTWDVIEWANDPSVTLVIANAMYLAGQGADLRAEIERIKTQTEAAYAALVPAEDSTPSPDPELTETLAPVQEV